MKGYISLPVQGRGRDAAGRQHRTISRHITAIIMFFAGLVALLQLVRPRQSELSAADQAFGPLQFRPDKTFQISIFEDLHFGENSWTTWGPQQDLDTVKIMNTILDAEPAINLVVLNGDLITGENVFLPNGTHYVDQLVAPLLTHNLTWASTYGNHDSNYNLSRRDLLDREQRWPNSRTTSLVSPISAAGITNYYLPVYPPDCTAAPDCRPALLLWFFDSRGGHFFQQSDPETGDPVPQPNWVDESVVAWFLDTNAALVAAHGGKPIPSLGFVHIPTNATLAAQSQDRIHPHHQPGINHDAPVAQQGQGWCADGVSNDTCAYGGQDASFMAAVAETEGMLALFSGHDHGNSWCWRWEGKVPGLEVEGMGTALCFGQHSGYGGYGDWIRGARQVEVVLGEQGVEVETWVRLESGSVVGRVALNETFGKDWYEKTPDDRTKCPDCQ